MATLYARPSDNIASLATWTFEAGGENASFPRANLYDGRPDLPFKASGLTVTLRATFAAPRTLQAVGLFAHNRPGATVSITNGAALNANLVIPAHAEDGLCLHGWSDLRAVANPTSTTWDFAVPTGTGNVYIGELWLVETLRTMPIAWDPLLGDGHLVETKRTRYGVKLHTDLHVRLRSVQATVVRETQRALMRALWRDAHGVAKPWMFALDETVNDAMLMAFADPELGQRLEGVDLSPTTVRLEETSSGVIA